MGSQTRRNTSLLDMLGLLSGGRATVTVGGRPLLSIQTESRTLDVDVTGVKQAGIGLTKLIKLQEGDSNILKGSESVAKELSSLGWKLTLYDEGSTILTMGHGVSRLTGRVWANPLKLERLLKALR